MKNLSQLLDGPWLHCYSSGSESECTRSWTSYFCIFTENSNNCETCVFSACFSPEWSDFVLGLRTKPSKIVWPSCTCFVCNRIHVISESRTTCRGLFWWPGITGKWKTSVTWSAGKQKLLCNSAQPELQRAEFKRPEACKLWNDINVKQSISWQSV